MDYQEVIKELKSLNEHCFDMIDKEDKDSVWIKDCKALSVAISAIQELREYKRLGTLEEVRKAAEKQRTKKPTYDGDGYAPDGTFVWDEWICPKCGNRYEVDYDDYDYCPKCGQHIDWSEEE